MSGKFKEEQGDQFPGVEVVGRSRSLEMSRREWREGDRLHRVL